MQCMNPEGLLIENMLKTKNYDIPLNLEIKSQFKERLFKMVKYYKESSNFKEIVPTNLMEIHDDKGINRVSLFTQLILLTKRGFLNEFRNPMGIRTRIITSVLLSFILVMVFAGVFIINIFF